MEPARLLVGVLLVVEVLSAAFPSAEDHRGAWRRRNELWLEREQRRNEGELEEEGGGQGEALSRRLRRGR